MGSNPTPTAIKNKGDVMVHLTLSEIEPGIGWIKPSNPLHSDYKFLQQEKNVEETETQAQETGMEERS